MMAHGNLFTRPDTFFGVCEGLSEDLHVHPNLLRLAFAFLLFLNVKAAVAGYVAAGVVVFVSRKLFRSGVRPADRATVPEPVASKPVQGENDDVAAPETKAA